MSVLLKRLVFCLCGMIFRFLVSYHNAAFLYGIKSYRKHKHKGSFPGALHLSIA